MNDTVLAVTAAYFSASIIILFSLTVTGWQMDLRRILACLLFWPLILFVLAWDGIRTFR